MMLGTFSRSVKPFLTYRPFKDYVPRLRATKEAHKKGFSVTVTLRILRPVLPSFFLSRQASVENSTCHPPRETAAVQ